MIAITIDGTAVSAEADDTILQAARRAEIYIPILCHHPDPPPRMGGGPASAVYGGETRIDNCEAQTPAKGIPSGCGLCVVEVADNGELKA